MATIPAHLSPGPTAFPSPLGCQKKISGAKGSLTGHIPVALFQVGLFRKSGVEISIHAFTSMNELRTSKEDQSAYDVADMVKQFFRDLPEPLSTNKLSETFLHIYHSVSV